MSSKVGRNPLKVVIWVRVLAWEPKSNLKRRPLVNAANILSDDMTLEQKLAAIDAAMSTGAREFNQRHGRAADAPVDPSDLTMCEGCQ